MRGKRYAQPTHLEAAMYHKSSLKLPKALRLSRLRVETLQLGLHVFVCQ